MTSITVCVWLQAAHMERKRDSNPVSVSMTPLQTLTNQLQKRRAKDARAASKRRLAAREKEWLSAIHQCNMSADMLTALRSQLNSLKACVLRLVAGTNCALLIRHKKMTLLASFGRF